MKLTGPNAEARRIAADFIERDEAVEAVKGGVLDRLRHHGAGELLKAHREFRLERTAVAQQQEIAQEIEEAPVDLGAIGLGRFDRRVDMALIVGMYRSVPGLARSVIGFTQIGAVNRQARDRRANRLVQFVTGVVAMARM